MSFCFFKQKTAYELRISDGSSDVCSSDLQAMTRWREVLVDFSRLERVLGRIPLSAAVSALRELADRTLFQPQSGDARVQVMGQLEAQGLSFDALWVTGIDDERFPAAKIGRAHV